MIGRDYALSQTISMCSLLKSESPTPPRRTHRFITLQAAGDIVPDGQEVRLRSLRGPPMKRGIAEGKLVVLHRERLSCGLGVGYSG
jgi:hypothetical protein